MLIFASFFDRCWKPFWIVVGSILRALGDQIIANMLSKTDAKISIGKNRSQNARGQMAVTKVVARRGVKGDVNLPPMVGGSEERKNKEGKKDGRKKGR